jgi:ABC-type antimicrobial peptide transport system permease subunit
VREFAIRVALGATRGAVLRLVLREGASIAAVGIAIGLVLSAPMSHLLRAAFVGLGPLSPWAFAIVPAMMLALTLTACLMPALRASMAAPVTVLRLE